MALFDPAIAIVLQHEGGFSNNPADRGGVTNFGITQSTLSEYLGVPATVEMVEGMSEELAKEIYKKLYWDKFDLDTVSSQQLSTAILDLSVLRGIHSVVCILQKLLGLPVDGIFGPVTEAKLSQDIFQEILAYQLLKETQLDLIHFASSSSSQLQFLPGWIRRTQDLLDLLI